MSWMSYRGAKRNGALLLAFIFLAGRPAAAQVNLAGVWDNFGILHEDWPDRLPGPEVGDYAGVPLNDAARLRADTWDASLITLPEYQCRVHPSDYVPSFAGIRIWEEFDPASQQLLAIRGLIILPGGLNGPSGWTGGRIPPSMRSTRRKAFPPGSGRETS